MKYNFICFNNDGFEGLRRPRQIVMQRLAAYGHRVLFVSSAYQKNRKMLKYGGIKRIESNLYWYHPPAFLPYIYRKTLGGLLTLIRVHILQGLIKLFFGARKVFFVSVPDTDYIELISRSTDGLVIYNIHDRYVNNLGEWSDDHWRMVQVSDVILCASPFLVQEMTDLIEKPIYYFPPGVDFTIFPRELKFSPRPSTATSRVQVGCIGSLGVQIDWDTIDKISDEFTNYDFIFIGIIRKNIENDPSFLRLRAKKNVAFFEKVPHQKIPEVISHFDICIAPYTSDEYTKGINPLKIYEYFSFGKPIIISSLPSMSQFKDIVYIAKNMNDWRQGLIDAASENDEIKFEARRKVALSQDYEIRVKTLLDLLEDVQSADHAGVAQPMLEARFQA